MTADIRLFPCLSDNFGYLVHDPATEATAAVDAPEAGPIVAALEAAGWTLTDILVTHHHHDHTGAIPALKERYGCRVTAPAGEADKIPLADATVRDGDTVRVGALEARVIETPGHTLGQVAYWFADDDAVFVGDTLFSIGAGRVFEGTYPMMWASLLKLRALPDATRIFCGHEYTESNIRFARTIDPDNAALKARADEAARQRAAGKATVPSRMGEEKRANPFLRADAPELAAALGMAGQSATAVFAEIRERKNKF
ncbi:MAG: hydroxyacylglutathione hydrolase [Xanthobacteraceae bacterium]|nr:MAG: hydroxyacylglutathione hydrolase [Xanthobacteraceae bacterium]